MASIIINGLSSEEVADLSAKALQAGHDDGQGNPHWAKYFGLSDKLQPAPAPTHSEEVI